MNRGYTLKKYLRESKITIACLGGVIFVFLIFKLTFQTIGYDTDEWILAPEATLEHWLGIGRYSLVFLKQIFGCLNNLNMLNILTYINIFIYTVLFIWFLNLDKEKVNIKKDLICGVALVSSPIFLEQYYFTLQSAEVSFGMILIVLSFITTYKFLAQKRYVWCIVTYLILIFCFGIYQSFINLYVLGVLICLYKLNNENTRNNLKKISVCFLIFVTAVVSYICISNLAISILEVPSSEYLSIGWFKESFSKSCLTVVIVIGRIVLGHGNVLNLSYTACLVYTILKMWKSKKKISWKNFYLISLLAVPFLLNVLTASHLLIRSVLCIPVLCAFIYYEFFQNSKVFDILICGFLLSQIVHCALLTCSEYARYKEDIAISKRIYSECNADSNTVVVFRGIREQEANRRTFTGQAMGNSFYEWSSDNRNADEIRIMYFMKLQGLELQYPTDVEMEQANQIVIQSAYPHNGYIVKENGVYYVNLGEKK